MQGLQKPPPAVISVIVTAFLAWIKMNRVARTQHRRRARVSLSESHHHPPPADDPDAPAAHISHHTPPSSPLFLEGFRASEVLEVLTSI